jgi:uncharacterized protein YjbJ (UPF0337 family)
MSGKTDVVKGRPKEAAGAVTGNDGLRTEGKTDQAIGKVKQVAEKAVDKVAEVSPRGMPRGKPGRPTC